ncbi:DMT family transporter [Cribrihabitans sp. XS_ASV171]
MKDALSGAALVVLYTALISSADGITKLLAGGYAAPQLYALSGGLVAVCCLVTARGHSLATTCPGAMALRSAATVLAALCFFNAFRLLPFAEVFPFIGLMPLLAGLMSGPVLGEHVRPASWAALGLGFAGVLCLFPQGLSGAGAGHLWALAAAVTGTSSMILARLVGRVENNPLALVYYPNLALCLTMGVALPFVWRPMPTADFGWVAGYALVLFLARWVLVIALRRLVAYAVTPLMNLQFVWMLAIGWLAFGEMPSPAMLLGALVVIGSGLYLLWDQVQPQEPSLRLRTDP